MATQCEDAVGGSDMTPVYVYTFNKNAALAPEMPLLVIRHSAGFIPKMFHFLRRVFDSVQCITKSHSVNISL